MSKTAFDFFNGKQIISIRMVCSKTMIGQFSQIKVVSLLPFIVVVITMGENIYDKFSMNRQKQLKEKKLCYIKEITKTPLNFYYKLIATDRPFLLTYVFHSTDHRKQT